MALKKISFKTLLLGWLSMQFCCGHIAEAKNPSFDNPSYDNPSWGSNPESDQPNTPNYYHQNKQQVYHQYPLNGKIETRPIQSFIVSEFNGLKQGNVYQLANGQIWEQTEAWIWIWVWARPKVVIYRNGLLYKMEIEKIDHPVTVRRIK